MPLSNLPLCRAAAIVVLALVAFVVFIFSIAAIKSYTERPAVLRLSVLNHAFIMATNLVPAALWHSRIAGPMLDVDQMKEYALSVSGMQRRTAATHLSSGPSNITTRPPPPP